MERSIRRDCRKYENSLAPRNDHPEARLHECKEHSHGAISGLFLARDGARAIQRRQLNK
jgi:hypothetical protein